MMAAMATTATVTVTMEMATTTMVGHCPTPAQSPWILRTGALLSVLRRDSQQRNGVASGRGRHVQL